MKRIVWLVLGFCIFLIMLLIGAPRTMSNDAWNMICIAVLMTILWISEAVELCVTALLPIVLFPILGISSFEKVTLEYANETIFLFMGGFLLAIALEKSRIHERFAMHCIRLIGGSPTRVMLGFMFVICILSMWVSNTAAVLMTIPICTAVVDKLRSQAKPEDEKEIKIFSKALYLSLAYAASIGGIGTLIGTPPNIVLASILEENNAKISFLQWMLFATPFAFIFLIIVWLLLSRIVMSKKARSLSIDLGRITNELEKLGPLTTHEKRVAIVFFCIVFMWIFRGFIDIDLFHRITDTTVAIAGAFALFIIPCGDNNKGRLIEWKDAEKLPWGILLLFGGGLALSHGFNVSGLSSTIATAVGSMHNIPLILFIIIISFSTVMLTELMSNTATANLLIPISISIAVGLGASPYMIAIPVAISASCAFMLPISTPPNAIVFSYGFISIKEMAKIGIFINLIGLVLTTLFSYYLIPLIFH